MFGQLKHFRLVVLSVLFSGDVLAQTPIAVDYLFTIGESGNSLGQFSRPQGLAVAASGDIYIADTGNHRVQRFTKDGKFLAYLGGLGSDGCKGKSPAKTELTSEWKNYVILLFL